MNKLELVKVELFKVDDASTSAGSGSQRSHEEANEHPMPMKNINKTPTLTTTTTPAIEERINEEGDYPDCGCDSDCGDLLRRKSA